MMDNYNDIGATMDRILSLAEAGGDAANFGQSVIDVLFADGLIDEAVYELFNQ